MLLFTDSFDHYSTTEITAKYTSKDGSNRSTIESGGRNSTNALVIDGNNGFVSKALGGNYATLVVGFAYFTNNLTNGYTVLSFQDASTDQCNLFQNTNGTLAIRRGTTVLATSTSAVSINTYYYLELKVTINGSTGQAELLINGLASGLATAANLDLTQTANNYANAFKLENTGGSGSSYFDDLYVIDTSGTYNNDFLGDIRVEALLPNAVGNYSEWTVSSGVADNYTYVDDNPPDGDTTYVYSNTPGEIDTYGLTELQTASGTVLGVQFAFYMRKDDAGTRFVVPMQYQNATTYSGVTNLSPGNDYAYLMDIWETNPATDDPYTLDEINTDAEFGQKLVQ